MGILVVCTRAAVGLVAGMPFEQDAPFLFSAMEQVSLCGNGVYDGLSSFVMHNQRRSVGR